MKKIILVLIMLTLITNISCGKKNNETPSVNNETKDIISTEFPKLTTVKTSSDELSVKVLDFKYSDEMYNDFRMPVIILEVTNNSLSDIEWSFSVNAINGWFSRNYFSIPENDDIIKIGETGIRHVYISPYNLNDYEINLNEITDIDIEMGLCGTLNISKENIDTPIRNYEISDTDKVLLDTEDILLIARNINTTNDTIETYLNFYLINKSNNTLEFDFNNIKINEKEIEHTYWIYLAPNVRIIDNILLDNTGNINSEDITSIILDVYTDKDKKTEKIYKNIEVYKRK